MRGEGGHDPEEDARACIELLRRKMENGPGWGEFKNDLESVFERMGRGTKRGTTGTNASSIRTAVVDYGNPAAMHGSKATSVVACTNDGEVVEGVKETVQSHHFVFARMMRLADLNGWTTPKQNANSDSAAPAPPPGEPSTQDPEELRKTLDDLNTHLKSIHACLPPKTAFIIFTGHADPRKMSALNQRKNAFETLIKAGMSPEQIAASGKDVRWTTQDARELESEVEIAKRGLVFLGIKQ